MADDLKLGLTITGNSESAKDAIRQVKLASIDLKNLEAKKTGEKTFLGRMEIEAKETEVKLKRLRQEMNLAQTSFQKVAVQGEIFNVKLAQQKKNIDSVLSVGKGMAAMAAPYIAVAAAAGAAAKSLADLAIRTADIGDRFDKLAPRLGMSVEQISALEYAAKLSGIEVENFDRGIQTLNKNLTDAAAGMGTAKDAFKALNISITDDSGALKSNYDIMLETADALSKYADGAEKSALAAKIFGEEAGPKMVPYLNQGKTGIEEMMKRAEELGIVWTEEDAKAAADLKDKVTELKTAFQAMSEASGKELIPMMTDLAKEMTKLIELVNENKDTIGTWAKRIGNAAIDMIPMVTTLRNLIHLRDLWEQRKAGPAPVELPLSAEGEVTEIDAELAKVPAPTIKPTKPPGGSGESKAEKLRKQQEAEAKAQADLYQKQAADELAMYKASEDQYWEWKAADNQRRLDDRAAFNDEYGNQADREVQILADKEARLQDLREQGIINEQEYSDTMQTIAWERRDAKMAEVQAYMGLVAAAGAYSKKAAQIQAATQIPLETYEIIKEGAKAASSLAIQDYTGAALHTTAALQHGLALKAAIKAAGGGGGGGAGSGMGGGGGGGKGGGGGRNNQKEDALATQSNNQNLLVKIEGLEGIRPDYLYTGDQLIGLVTALQKGYKEGSIAKPFD
ncbi:MAG: hypothetical protein WC551_11345 [Patescibacteria group bacterium]